MFSTLQEVAFAFSYSAKKLVQYQEQLSFDPNAQENMGKRTKLRDLCETRWSSRVDALFTFRISVVQCYMYL